MLSAKKACWTIGRGMATLTLMLTLAAVGCEDTSPVVEAEQNEAGAGNETPTAENDTQPVAENNAGEQPPLIQPSVGSNPGGGPEIPDELKNANPFGNANQNAGQAPPANNGNTYRRAEVGVGKAGASLRNETGIGRMIATPATSLFATRERAVFSIQIPQALQLFKATNGRTPKSHDEFMTQIIRANRIKLPELPAGQRYVYDPKQAQLMVEMPQGAAN